MFTFPVERRNHSLYSHRKKVLAIYLKEASWHFKAEQSQRMNPFVGYC